MTFIDEEVFNQYNFVRFVNEDMAQTCQNYQILGKLSSHSYRVEWITKLLKTLSVQKVAEIIGHADIDSTMSYQMPLIKTRLKSF